MEDYCHVNEHSIELATVWLHRALGQSNAKMLPVLCGSFGRLLADGAPDPTEHPQISAAIDLLQEVAKQRRTVFIAAADLAHVGPAFGDSELVPADSEGRQRVKSDDEALLKSIVRRNPRACLEAVKDKSDRNKICGLAPIYMMLWASQATTGTWDGYQQCKADEDGTSFVSIAGAALY